MERYRPLKLPNIQFLLKLRSSLQKIFIRTTLRYPSRSKLDMILAKSESMPFSYSEVGATQKKAPKGYDFDQNKKRIGLGFFAYKTAKQAFEDWQMFNLGWVRIYRNENSIEAGQNVVVSFRLLGLWWHNTCEIIYTIDTPRSFGFAYGTKYHVESGEELFLVRIDEEQTVWYDITAFSRPKFWLTKLVYPLARKFQQRFVRQSSEQMEASVKAKYGKI